MSDVTKFPLSAGFLFPNGEHYSTKGKGHEWLANRIIEDRLKLDTRDIADPENYLQTKCCAILIRYRWGERLIYLPMKAPPTDEGRFYFQKAVEYYNSQNFHIINIRKISLDNIFSSIEKFIGEEYEDLKIFSKCCNYTNTIIMRTDGKYIYNPERIGDWEKK